MGDVIQAQITELNQIRADYNDLFEKFKLSNRLSEERELLLRQQKIAISDEVDKLKRENMNLNSLLYSQNEAKVIFEQDAHQIIEAGRLLEAREIEITHKFQGIKQINQALLDEISNEKRYSHELTEQISALKSSIELDHVTNAKYQRSLEENVELQRRIRSEMIGLDRFRELEAVLESDYVELTEYNRMSDYLAATLEAKSFAEETCSAAQQRRDEADALLAEAEAKVVSLKGRVEQTERELKESRTALERSEADCITVKEELSASEVQRIAALEQVMELETSKNMLMTQIGNTRMALRKETELKESLMATVHAHQEEVDHIREENDHKTEELTQEFNSTIELLTESNNEAEQNLRNTHQLNDQLNTACNNYQKTIIDLRTELQGMAQQCQEMSVSNASLHNNNDVLAESCRNYRQILVENNKKLKPVEELQRTINTVKEEKILLVAHIRYLQAQIDEFEEAVLGETSTSPSRGGASNNFRHSHRQSLNNNVAHTASGGIDFAHSVHMHEINRILLQSQSSQESLAALVSSQKVAQAELMQIEQQREEREQQREDKTRSSSAYRRAKEEGLFHIDTHSHSSAPTPLPSTDLHRLSSAHSASRSGTPTQITPGQHLSFSQNLLTNFNHSGGSRTGSRSSSRNRGSRSNTPQGNRAERQQHRDHIGERASTPTSRPVPVLQSSPAAPINDPASSPSPNYFSSLPSPLSSAVKLSVPSGSNSNRLSSTAGHTPVNSNHRQRQPHSSQSQGQGVSQSKPKRMSSPQTTRPIVPYSVSAHDAGEFSSPHRSREVDSRGGDSPTSRLSVETTSLHSPSGAERFTQHLDTYDSPKESNLVRELLALSSSRKKSPQKSPQRSPQRVEVSAVRESKGLFSSSSNNSLLSSTSVQSPSTVLPRTNSTPQRKRVQL